MTENHDRADTETHLSREWSRFERGLIPSSKSLAGLIRILESCFGVSLRTPSFSRPGVPVYVANLSALKVRLSEATRIAFTNIPSGDSAEVDKIFSLLAHIHVT